MSEQRFTELWNVAINTPSSEEDNDSSETNGISVKLANSILKADESGECLTLNDWTKADY